MSNETPVSFELSISGRDDGTLEAVYIHLTKLPIKSTKELREDVLMADYSAEGTIVGFEILAPVKLADIVKFIDSPLKAPFQKFMEESAPRGMVAV
jgi:uncharacterized protein YuzE